MSVLLMAELLMGSDIFSLILSDWGWIVVGDGEGQVFGNIAQLGNVCISRSERKAVLVATVFFRTDVVHYTHRKSPKINHLIETSIKAIKCVQSSNQWLIISCKLH